MDPFGGIPVFLSLLNHFDPKKRKQIILREMGIALVVLSLFLFCGKYILSGLHIGEPALSISGGVILFFIAIKMIFPKEVQRAEAVHGEEPLIVPLAVPLVAGPSSMVVLILFSTQYPGKILHWFSALIIAWTFSLTVILLSDYLGRLLGKRILRAIERLMGMILTTMAVQMLLGGVREFLRSLS